MGSPLSEQFKMVEFQINFLDPRSRAEPHGDFTAGGEAEAPLLNLLSLSKHSKTIEKVLQVPRRSQK